MKVKETQTVNKTGIGKISDILLYCYAGAAAAAILMTGVTAALIGAGITADQTLDKLIDISRGIWAGAGIAGLLSLDLILLDLIAKKFSALKRQIKLKIKLKLYTDNESI